MAKDPAFLFYSSDFIVGTYEMTDAQVGQYIRLLCLQHAKGHLKESLMVSTMGGKLDEAIACKFLIDENGHYYNERLDAEVNRRREYSESRARNRMSRADASQGEDTGTQEKDVSIICETHVPHMETETITTNKIPNLDKNVPKKGVKGETKHKHGTYQNVLLSDTDLAKLKEEYPDWNERIERLSEYIESKGAKYKNHLATIRAWARKDKENGQSGTGSGVHQPVRTPAESRFAKLGDPI